VDPLAAVALVAPLYNVMAGLGSGLGVGASAVVSRMIGTGRREKAYRPDMAYTLTVLCLYAPFFSVNPLCSGYLHAPARESPWHARF
jgi:Na+-driven multidrug efflux pump